MLGSAPTQVLVNLNNKYLGGYNMKTLLIITLFLSSASFAQYSNSRGEINAEGAKVKTYNLCIEQTKFYQDKTGAITKVGTGACSSEKIPKYHECKNGKAYLYSKITKKLEIVRKKDNSADLTCTLE